MQRDMKVGMALGVALVGIVGALFFRRDPAPPEPVPPALHGVDELDKQIVEKPKAPYLQGLDEEVESPAPPTQTAAAKPKPSGGAYELPGFLTNQDEAEHRAVLSSNKPATPDPIASPASREKGQTGTTATPESAPAHNRAWEPVGGPTGKSSTPPKPATGVAAPGASPRTHITQAGETLSSLAARYLGSSARFRELYEANRSVLKSPDDLPDGVTLVIPETGKSAPAVSPAAHTAESTAPPKIRKASVSSAPAAGVKEPAISGADPSGKLRFAPVNRGAYSAGRTPPEGRAAPVAE